MNKPVYFLNLREKKTITKRVIEILISLIVLSLMNYIFVSMSFSNAILSAIWVIGGIIFIFNPINNWLSDRKERKLRVKENN